MKWERIHPNEAGDWINQRNPVFATYYPLGDKKGDESDKAVFVPRYSSGIKTNRDAWCYNSAKTKLQENIIPDLEIVGKSQCFPLYYYEAASGSSHSVRSVAASQTSLSVTEKDDSQQTPENEYVLNEALSKYADQAITKEDIFYYVYGFLHSREYRATFSADLKKILARSAIEWIMGRYAVTRDDASGIQNDPNEWAAEHGNPWHILDLLLSVITVSIKTMKIVESLPRFEC